VVVKHKFYNSGLNLSNRSHFGYELFGEVPKRDPYKKKPTRCTNFSNLFLNETLHVSDSSSFHHQEFSTVHTAMVYVIQVCRQLASRIRMEPQFHPDPTRNRPAGSESLYRLRYPGPQFQGKY